MQDDAIPRVPLQLSRGCVVASLQIDLHEEVLQRFQKDLLEYIGATRALGVLIDVGGVELMDASDWDALRRTMAMAALMGARPVITGLQPGVVSALVELEVDVKGIEAAPSLEEGLELFEDFSETEEESDSDEESALGDAEEEGATDSWSENDPGIDSDSYRQ